MAFSGLNKVVEAVVYDVNGNPVTVINGYQAVASLSGGAAGDANTASMFVTANTGAGNIGGVADFHFNGTNWDRNRGNVESQILASAARTTTQTGSDRTSFDASGALLWVTITNAGTGNITPSLQFKDPVSGDYKTVWAAAAALVANGDAVYLLDPGGGTVSSFTESVRLQLARTYRWVITANNGNPITYSVGEVLLRN